MTVPNGDVGMKAYAHALKEEMDAFSDVFRNHAFGSVYIGGGTPTFMLDEELSSLLNHVRSRFRLTPGAQFYVETSPATLTESKLQTLIFHGVNRVTLGVQSLDDGIVSGVNRVGQSRKKVEYILRSLLSLPLIVDVDLMMGLPGQSTLSFLRDLYSMVKIGPQVIHVYSYDSRPQTLASRFHKRLEGIDWKDSDAVRLAADRILKSSGYRQSNWVPGEDIDNPLEERQDGSLRKFGASVLGFGLAAKSHAFGSCWYEHRPIALAKSSMGRIPPYFCFESNLEEEMRHYAVRNLSRFHHIDRSDFRRIFHKDVVEHEPLATIISQLERLKIISVDSREICWKITDILSRQVLLRKFYSPSLVSALVGYYEKERARFYEVYDKSSVNLEENIRRKISDFYFQRVYYRESSPLKTQGFQKYHALS